jgi:hypothetical protein
VNGSDHRDGTPPSPRSGERDFEVIVLGAGIGGYTTAFRAADLASKRRYRFEGERV